MQFSDWKIKQFSFDKQCTKYDQKSAIDRVFGNSVYQFDLLKADFQ
jgi:hypothetical protein